MLERLRESLLFYAAQNRSSTECLEYLVSIGGNINARNLRKKALIHYAAKNKNS